MSGNYSEEMTVQATRRTITIKIPVALLIQAQKLREDSITVTNRDDMLNYIRAYLLDFGGDQERGSTAFEDLLDQFFTEALEDGETWLRGWWEDER